MKKERDRGPRETETQTGGKTDEDRREAVRQRKPEGHRETEVYTGLAPRKWGRCVNCVIFRHYY